MPKKIRFIKICDGGKVGDIKNYSNGSADSLVEQGYAEYVNEKPKKNTKKSKKTPKNNKKTKKRVQEVRSKSSVENVKDVENVKSVKSVEKPYSTLSTFYISFSEVLFEPKTKEEILKFLCDKKRCFTYDKIAEELGKKEGTIRQNVLRNKELFSVVKKGEKKSVENVEPSEYAINMINQRISDLKSIREKKEQREKELKAKESKEKEHLLNVKEYLQKHKPKREGFFILIDYEDVLLYSPKLADLLLEETEKFIEQVELHFSNKLSVKIINFPELNQTSIEDIRKEHLNGILCIEGRVTSIGEVRPVATKMKYSCPSCGNLISKEQNYRIGYIEEPKQCSCGRKGGFHVEEKEETNACFIQIEDLQDKTDNPHSRRIKGVLFKSLCQPETIKKFTPGNEIKVTGILKDVPIRKGNKVSLFSDWIFEVNDVELIEKDVNIDEFEEETVNDIKSLASNIDSQGLEYLDNSFAPSVHGYQKIKHALMLQLSNKRNEAKNKSTRNKSNILLIGDPGIAKTVLGKYASKVSSGSRCAVGGGSSAVGITASVVKEEESMGGYRVEPGAMILAKDFLFLDELNNLAEEDKPKLQEGMSEQRVSINKANLHVQMKVTCGILAVANPVYGHFKEDAKETLSEQFNIPTPILNRFDTVFMMRDIVNGDSDKKIAERMMQRHTGNLDIEYSSEFLKKYFAYVRNSEEPEIDSDIANTMKEIYSACRRTYNSGVKINPRFFESFTRMSCACAKMRLSKKVETKDLERAFAILSQSQYQVSEDIIAEMLIQRLK